MYGARGFSVATRTRQLLRKRQQLLVPGQRYLCSSIANLSFAVFVTSPMTTLPLPRTVITSPCLTADDPLIPDFLCSGGNAAGDRRAARQ